ncbi:matrix metalloproteinase-16-like [Tribolium castaneum]|uniref:matrix metalloproteinase-16-like n=1 Tax=Tribolium castaneum TaxID=7070 RepID=UPI0030FE1B02
MCVLILYLLISTSIVTADNMNNSASDEQDVVNFLSKYGYLKPLNNDINSNNSIRYKENYNEALFNFQEFYNLPATGEINQETLKLIKQSRCGLPDAVLSDYTLHPKKWSHFNITWRAHVGDSHIKSLVRKAFSIWEEFTNLKFTETPRNRYPNIFIAFTARKHKYFIHQRECSSDFDGPGNVLAHADFPNDINVTEIHIDNAESWSYSTTVDASYSDSPSLLNVIIHELGHTLGLEHSSVNTSIMYSFYSNSRSKLDQDDIWAIQNLYGIKSKQKPTFNVSTTTTQKSLLTTSTPKNVTVLPKDNNNNKFPDLCSLQTIDKFLIVKTHLYIFYKKNYSNLS